MTTATRYSAASVAKQLVSRYDWDYDAAYAASWAWLHNDAMSTVSVYRIPSLIEYAKDVTITPQQEKEINDKNFFLFVLQRSESPI